MLNDIFESAQCRAFEITETFDLLKFEGKIDSSIMAFASTILDELKTISIRDSFELIIEANGNNIRIHRVIDSDIADFKEELREYDGPGEFNIALNIIKETADRVTSIYSLSAFSKYVAGSDVDNILSAFEPVFDGHHRFETFHAIDDFGSGTIIFRATRHCDNLDFDSTARNEKLDLFGENSTTVGQKGIFLPDDFNLLKLSGNAAIDTFFSKACSVYCLAFISNFSRMSGDQISYKINGYKSIIADNVNASDLMGSAKILYKIYDWAYSGGGNSDKIGLVRNMLSLHLDANGAVKFDRDVWEAIKSNYQIYLKRNIQSYLEVKNKLGEFIVESTSKTYALADQILDSFKNNVLIILTFILTVVVINGLKDSGEVTVFSNAYLAIVLLLSAVSAAWLLFTRSEVIQRFDNASETIKKVLKINYGQILMDVEIDESIDPVVTINREYMVRQMSRYTKWWIILLAVFVVSFGFCNIIFTQMAKPQKKGEAFATSKSESTSPSSQSPSVGSVTAQEGAAVSQPLRPKEARLHQVRQATEVRKAAGNQAATSDKSASTK